MWNFLWRAITNPIDYSGFLDKRTLKFVEQIDEGNGIYSFIFTSTKPFTWKAGQHGVFTLPNHYVHGRKWRAFSIASASSEGKIRIGTIIPPEPSDFKSKLLTLVPGDVVHMRGPFGEFHTENSPKHIVGIAGGIGITPFRAIALEITQGINTTNTLELIYAGKNNYFTYEADCQAFAAHPNITITFVNTPDEVNAAIDAAVATHSNEAIYYISGSPGMIGAIKTRLNSAGIENVINDPFKGY